MKARDPYKKTDTKRFKTQGKQQRRQARENKRNWE